MPQFSFPSTNKSFRNSLIQWACHFYMITSHPYPYRKQNLAVKTLYYLLRL